MILEKLFNKFFYALVLLMPIMILPYGVDYISKYVLLVIISSPILVILFLHMLESRALVNIKPIFIFFIPIFLSTIFSVNKFISFLGTAKNREGLITYVLYLVIFLSIITFVKSKKQLLNISVCLSIGLFLNNLFGIYEMLFNNFGLGVKFGPRLMTTFGDPNDLGGFTILTLPLILAALYLTDNRKIRLFILSNALLTSVILIFSGSRAALMGLLITLTFFALYLRKINYKFLIGIVFAFLLIGINPFLSQRLKLSFFKVDFFNRISSIESSLKYLATHPLFGTGPDTFRVFTGNYGGIGGAHSAFINLAQTLGLLGLVSFLFIFIYVLLKGFQLIGREKETVSIPYLISILSFSIFFIFNYSTSILNIFLWISLALIICLSNMENRYLNTQLPKLNFLLPLVGIICFLLILFALRIPIGCIYWQQGQANENAGKYDEAISKYKLAVKMIPDDEIFLGDLGYLSIELAENGNTSYLPLAKESFEQIKRNINPADPEVNEILEKLKNL